MADVNEPFLDTSVLLGGLIDMGRSSQGPMAILDALAEGSLPSVMTAWHCCLEFYSVATRLPEEYRLTSGQAHSLLQEGIFSRFKIGALPARNRMMFFKEAVTSKTMGGRIYDHHIAAVAAHMGATAVVTENRKHFASLVKHGIPVMTARDFLESHPLKTVGQSKKQ